MGAWIETREKEETLFNVVSHPMWVRGLKLTVAANSEICKDVAPYVGAWIETGVADGTLPGLARRTLCGCVD